MTRDPWISYIYFTVGLSSYDAIHCTANEFYLVLWCCNPFSAYPYKRLPGIPFKSIMNYQWFWNTEMHEFSMFWNDLPKVLVLLENKQFLNSIQKYHALQMCLKHGNVCNSNVWMISRMWLFKKNTSISWIPFKNITNYNCFRNTEMYGRPLFSNDYKKYLFFWKHPFWWSRWKVISRVWCFL